MRKRSAANSAASSPPVPARTSRIALRSSSASFGNSPSLTCCSSTGRRARRICSSSSASAFSSASSPDWVISISEASSSRARRNASMPSTIGLSSLYSFDNRAKSAPVIPVLPSASRSSAWRRTSCSRCPSSDASITRSAGQRLQTGPQLAQRQIHRHLDLLTGVKISQRDHIARDLVLADQHRYPRVDPVSPAHAACDVPGVTKIHWTVVIPEPLRESQLRWFRSFPNRHHGDGARRSRWFVDQHCEPLDPSSPAHTGQCRPAHHLDQPVIAAAAHHGALRAEVCCDEFECRMRVVIEPPHEPGVQPIIYSEPVKPAADPIEEIARLQIEVIGKSGSFPGDALVGFFFRIEDAQRVAVEPPPAVLRQFGDPCRKV